MHRLKAITQIDFSHGKPVKVITLFAIPLMLGNLFQMFYNMVDTMIVGKYVSTTALAAVGATTPVIDLLLGLVIGLANGLSLVIAQKVGAGERQTAKKAMINVFYLMLGCSVGIMIIAITCSQSLFALIHISEALLPGATTYATIIFMGTIFTACYHYESAILRAYGNSLAPLLFLILSAILNIVLDLVFVIVFHLGIAGVALSTITAQLICCGACFIYLVKQGLLKFERQDYQLDMHCIKEHIQVGMPMAFKPFFQLVFYLCNQF